MAFCSKCGFNLSPTDGFCTKCGAAAQPGGTALQIPQNTLDSVRTRRKWFWIAGIGCGVVFLGGILIAVLAAAGVILTGAAIEEAIKYEATPSAVAQSVFVELQNGRLAVDKMTQGTVKDWSVYGEKLQASAVQKGTIVSTQENIIGDQAEVILNFRNGSRVKVDLVRINGNWLVSEELQRNYDK